MYLLSHPGLKIIIAVIILSLVTFDATLLFSPKAHAICDNNPGIVTNGLITMGVNSAATIGNNIPGSSYTSPCITSQDYAGFPSLTNYQELKDTYYTHGANTATLTINGNHIQVTNQDKVFYWNSNLTLGVTGCAGCADSFNGNHSHSFVVFVDGDLNIDDKVTPSDYTSGALVFIVQGNINISPSVHEIDASLIAQGQICDDYEAGACNPSPNPVTPPAGADADLVILGSVIDLNSASDKIIFNRTLFDNSTTPAEKITTQARNLVDLKDILSTTLSIQTQL